LNIANFYRSHRESSHSFPRLELANGPPRSADAQPGLHETVKDGAADVLFPERTPLFKRKHANSSAGSWASNPPGKPSATIATVEKIQLPSE
jgi:hypothetical protein